MPKFIPLTFWFSLSFLSAVALADTLELPVLAAASETPLVTVPNAPPTVIAPAPIANVPLNAISPATLQTFTEVFDLVRRKYVGRIDDETLFRYAMAGMLGRLDGHSEFLDAEAFTSLQAFTEGSVAGVGMNVYFNSNDNAWVVTDVLADSSAAQAGIMAGDFLHQVGTTTLDGKLSAKNLSQLLSGLAGSQVEVAVSKAGRDKHTLTLQRTTPINDGLTLTMEGGIAVVKLPIFTDKTRQQLNEALAQVNTPITAMIIDVRGNPGGVLTAAVEVASLFLEEVPVVQVTEPNKPPQTFATSGAAPLAVLPVLLLQDRYSASAAEVLALALQKDANAIIAGERSYGKGSVQSIIPVGQQEAVKLTTAYYEGVGANQARIKINGVGVTPTLALDGKSEDWLAHALSYMQTRQLPVGITASLSDDY